MLVYRWVAALSITMVAGSISLLIVILSFGYLRNFCTVYILKYTSRLILIIMGYKGKYPASSEFPKYPVMYTFNHSSHLDIFLLTGLGIPNCRFLFSTKTLKYIPLVIAAKAIGTFYIPMQESKKRRLKFLIRITNLLKRKKLSLVASSEGVRPYIQGISPFNRGVYHLAMEAGLPIVTMFIYIPEESNPMMGNKHAKGGTIKLELMEEVATKDWKLENLDMHKDSVRDLYVKRYNELNPNQQIS